MIRLTAINDSGNRKIISKNIKNCLNIRFKLGWDIKCKSILGKHKEPQSNNKRGKCGGECIRSILSQKMGEFQWQDSRCQRWILFHVLL